MTDSQFEILQASIQTLQIQLAGVESRLDARLDAMDGRLRNVEQRLSAVESDIHNFRWFFGYALALASVGMSVALGAAAVLVRLI